MNRVLELVSALGLFIASASAQGQVAINFFPREPVASSPVFLSAGTFRSRCYGAEYRPEATRVEWVGSRIAVRMPEPLILIPPGAPCPSYPLVSLGKIPAGQYGIDIYWRTEGPPSFSGTLTITTDPAAPIGLPAHDFSGVYHDAKLDGSGLVVAQNPQGRIAAMWATHDAQGKQAWYMIALGSWSKGSPPTSAGQVYRASLIRTRDGASPTFPADIAAPGAVLEAVGEIELRFSVSNVDEVTAVYRIGDATGTRVLTRLPY
jgi:hypothetical protein